MSDVKEIDRNTVFFPALRSCEGFELVQGCPNCYWGAVGLLSRDLKVNLGGGQGKMYIVPIQKSLSTKPSKRVKFLLLRRSAMFVASKFSFENCKNISGTVRMNPENRMKMEVISCSLHSIPLEKQEDIISGSATST